VTVRLNLSDDEAHALRHLLASIDAHETPPPTGVVLRWIRSIKRIAQNLRTVRSKLERAERRRRSRNRTGRKHEE
jgi:hypothetical protein